MYKETTASIVVTVKPFYLEDQSSPDENHYVWAYSVKIENKGADTVQLRNRYWRITDARGQTQEVRGAGVVGEQPVLKPGEAFEYTSGTPLSTHPGSCWGPIRCSVPTARLSTSKFRRSRSIARSRHRPARTDRRPRPADPTWRSTVTEAKATAIKTSSASTAPRPRREDAEEAVRTLLRWAGDDPTREGLLDTPDRVVRAYEEWFQGYSEDPVEILKRTFEETDGYDELVVMRDIRLELFCEHHIAPIIGLVHVGYLPDKRIVGISKLARLVEVYGRRLQVQEKLTAQIANAIEEVLQPRGVAVVCEAAHHCMTTRGVHKTGTTLVTSRMLGALRNNPNTRREFLAMIGPHARTIEE